MARPREFDRTRALEKAMNLFWDKGYQATSVQDLVRSMGINRGSLYDTFGDKHALFQESLQQYEKLYTSKIVDFLDTEPSGKRAIEKFFHKVLEDCLSDKGGRGCFFANSIVELYQHDPETAEKLGKSFLEMERAFLKTVKRGQDSGEISKSLGPREMARFFTNSLMGLKVVEKSSPSPKVLQDIVKATLSVLKK